LLSVVLSQLVLFDGMADGILKHAHHGVLAAGLIVCTAK
jgi:hypothetical protein